MKNIALFVILAVLTVAALVAWNVVGRQSPSTSQVPTPTEGTPTPEAGSALRRFFGGLNNQVTPAPSVSISPTGVPTGTIIPTSTPSALTKGGLPATQPTHTPSVLSSTTEKTFVTYTDTGFSPNTITVKSGTTVMFINDASTSMWVASDDHPSHQKLAEFDMEKGVRRTGSFEYRFANAGIWTYHNDTNVSHKGTIIVQ